jgi:hypothetical protein
MPSELREAVIAELARLSLSARSFRTRLTAIKILLQADRQNLERACLANEETLAEELRKRNEMGHDATGQVKAS